VYDLPQRVPIRLAQENGKRIDLDVHTMDINVRRVFSAFPIPFTGGFNAGIDLNQAAVEIELQGVFVDEPGQAASAKATASITFGGGIPPFAIPEDDSSDDGALTFPPRGNNSSGGFRIAGAAFNPWGAGPILPTSPPVSDADEGQENFLFRMHNKYFDVPVAYWMNEAPQISPPAGNCIRFVFDSKRSGSVKEPFAYPKMVTRNTDLTTASSNCITATSTGTLSISITSGDPRTWFETPDDLIENMFAVSVDGTELGYLISVTSSAIEIMPLFGITASTSSSTNNKAIQIAARGNLGYYNRATDRPIIAIPIKHIFTESPPNFADGSSRSVGSTDSPAKGLAYIISQALSSSTATTVAGITDRALNAAGGKELTDAFTVSVEQFASTDSATAATKIIIEQKFAFDLEDNGGIPTNIPYNLRPTIQGFTGGLTGNKVKSAGDKVQDLLGIVANSNNANKSTQSSFVGTTLDFVSSALEIIDLRSDLTVETGDYIFGIQIPYDTQVTKGQADFEDEYAQRNFFITNSQQATFQKVARSNTTKANRHFIHSATNSRRNGIKAIVTDFVVDHDAQERLYNFSMKLMAVDHLL
jgi:hypothetical protein